MIGDGSYLMMNSDIYSSVLTGHKLIIVVCDNGGYAGDQSAAERQGVPSFNNQIADCRVKKPFAVDFAKHAESMGALARHVESIGDLGRRSNGRRRPTAPP
jgi:3D-(3,5/4)-trihydroxycyclohexane-1,2-dione acylhydrolase (decyclizing)